MGNSVIAYMLIHSHLLSKIINDPMSTFDIYETFLQDSELMELRETIEALKTRNEEAQAVIHGALNNQDVIKGL